MSVTADDYVNQMVGTPWLEGSDDPSNGGLDCWGAVVDSFRRIDGLELPVPDGRDQCSFLSAGDLADRYDECGSDEGAIFACYDRSGAMIHVGRVLAGVAFHAVGNRNKPQAVSTWPIATLERLYRAQGGSVKYYRYTSL